MVLRGSRADARGDARRGGGYRGNRWRASEAYRARYHPSRGLPANAPTALRGRIERAFRYALEYVFWGRTRKQSRERIEMSSRIPQDIERQAFDLIVVGAGINGAGIARDAAMRGLRVLLLDKGDISSGTTQWATRLIHGGLRYLEYYEFALVRESLRDREAILHIAQHLVKPLGSLVPIYERSSRGPLMIRLGMNVYDVLSYDRSMDRHKMLSRKKVQDREPGLNPEGLKAAAFYYDAQVEYAERVAVENAISARNNGATIITYANVDRLILENGDVKGVEFTDVLGDN